VKKLPGAILDASALLAFLYRERGSSDVRFALLRGAAMSAVNWAEVLAKFSDLGHEPWEVVRDLASRDIYGRNLAIFPFDDSIARDSALIRKMTRDRGLSLGDRACLSTGRRFHVPVVTADKCWAGLKVGVEILVIR